MDLIDRQAAIKTLEKGLPSEPLKSKYTEGITVGFGLAITWIEQLPAVQTCDDAVSRAAAINAVKKNTFRLTFAEKQGCEGHVAWSAEAVYSDVIEGALLELPSVQPEPLSDAYTKAVWTWLLDYQIKAAKLKGRYTPYEVLSWVANDWRKENEGSD